MAAGEESWAGFATKEDVAEQALPPVHGWDLTVCPFGIAQDTSQELLSGIAGISCEPLLLTFLPCRRDFLKTFSQPSKPHADL